MSQMYAAHTGEHDQVLGECCTAIMTALLSMLMLHMLQLSCLATYCRCEDIHMHEPRICFYIVHVQHCYACTCS
jgi:hypothetical protein